MITSPFIRALLNFPARLYELGVRARLALYERQVFKTSRLSALVISVGNITVGGTGKTPCVAYIARHLRDAGHDVAILSRGYRRASSGRVEVSNGKEILCTPREAGDEPYVLAASCPGVRVVVDSDRTAAGRWLEAQTRIAAFILDDGFQHVRLARDLNIALIDATDPDGGGALPPFGRLREPLAGLRRADAVVVTRTNQPFDESLVSETIEKYCRPQTPVFHAAHSVTGLRSLSETNVTLAPGAFAGHPVAALSGIARPATFAADLTKLGMQIVLRRDFPDHHRYTQDEFTGFARDAAAAGAQAIITTAKDAANLPPSAVSESNLPVYVAEIEFCCREEAALQELLRHIIARRPSAQS